MKSIIFICTLFLLVVIFFNLDISKMNKTTRTELNFATSSLPYSSDPLDYDQYIHHYAFTSVLGTLVSSSKKGEITSQVAESWKKENNSKKWIFTLRKNLKYSNGDMITAKDFELSLKRIAYFHKKLDSESGIMENLIGFKNIKNLESVQGISSLDNNLILEFSIEMPDLLTKISFGFYSLAHPSLFDHKTGEWLNKRKIISSNSYEVKSWTNQNFELSLREEIPYVDYQSAVKNINFISLSSVKKSKDLDNVDMLVADKSTLMVDDSFEYIGSSEGYKIGYAECYGWNDSSKPMSSLKNRKWLRFKFYESLKKTNFEITNSFFPPSLPGITKIDFDISSDLPATNSFTVSTHTMLKSSKIKENEGTLSIQEIIDQGLKSLGDDSQIKVTQKEFDENIDIEKQFDLAINGTGIEADQFLDTVRFMFLSKQGIKLPDESGEILLELKKEKPDVNLINKLLWDQAIIWPIRHYSKGYWFKKASVINYEKLNLDLPAIDFQFVKWN